MAIDQPNEVWCADITLIPLRHGFFHAVAIMNMDQDSRLTGVDWITTLTEAGIRIAMDGRGRCMDNIFIEHPW